MTEPVMEGAHCEAPPVRRALVLSGGGARGAYEAGVLRFLFEELPKDLGGPPSFDIVTGTSVGAIHACYVTATAHLGPERGHQLEHVWDSLEADLLFGSATRELLRLPRRLLGLLRTPETLQSEVPPERLFGLLDTRNLEALVRREIPWRRIRTNLREKRIQALSVAATEIATGRVVVFVDTEADGMPPWTRDASIVARTASIGLDHALASAAIPFLFPAVRIDETYFTDGGLRLNTPLSPALRLGANRVLIVALRKGATVGAGADIDARRIEHFGNPLFLFGKVLNALLLDHVETDLAHMHVLNDVLRQVCAVAGDGVLDAVNTAVTANRGQGFKVIDDLVVRPSEDLGMMAGECAQGRDSGAAVRLLLRSLGFGDEPLEADLLSYLFFDKSYTRPLMQLGFDDAARMRESLVEFFSD